jgi:hypothetical protein
MTIIDVVGTGRFPELGGFKTAFEPPVFTVSPFPIDYEAESFSEA